MTEAVRAPYLEPTQESGRALMVRQIAGEVVMLNLLKFRDVADYSGAPELAPGDPISGAEAYDRYIRHTIPHLRKSGGEVLFFGSGGRFLIGPAAEDWDAVLVVRQSSVQAFVEFASNAEYLAGMGHRVAALLDSRLLPLVPRELPASAPAGRP